MTKIICIHCNYDQNDIILSSCLLCKKPLPTVNIDGITDEDIVLSTGEWVGKTGDSSFHTTQDFNIWKTAFLKNKYLGLNIGGVDKGVVEMSKEKIDDIANKYLSILETRAISNTNLKPVYISLKAELDAKRKKLLNKAGGQKKVILIALIIFIVLIIFAPVIIVMRLIF
jgi:hypothetical protein